VENALKYSDPPAKVTIKAVELPSGVELSVIDEGHGMREDQLNLIFDRFHQLDSSMTRDRGGFGLGLYIVKNLVEAHNGSIEVESKPGEGSIFRIRLPKRSQREQQSG
jgi:two-component system phosphate regulon sensor histidine kinase PhoR